jgi:hypothetical protein
MTQNIGTAVTPQSLQTDSVYLRIQPQKGHQHRFELPNTDTLRISQFQLLKLKLTSIISSSSCMDHAAPVINNKLNYSRHDSCYIKILILLITPEEGDFEHVTRGGP